ncbi:GDP-mannose 4,6-dehydratase [Campylobacter showae]|uniref:GDP-mannose 4,6-dehydratase n=1 Tax=Campylobacter showae RM3277 TaxID=553219 RepID=C6RGX9_9BACT|nr:GDP-mannose 4,6-dehydratase [Campylobacter showae]EET79335.1 GDP-mannose 4,6-dehydratase [Campylobacter showae RM3277]QCD49740.1 GDP-mannose 4,6-dehydratase [Campylobacter showae]
MKKAIITGVGGQDGAYLARYLIDLGYEIYGGYRRAVSPNFWRLNELSLLNEPNFHLVEFELTDPFNILSVVNEIRPEEIYNLAAQSFVGVSFKEPFHTANATGIGTLNILEAIKTVDKSIKFYQASTSEMFGKVQAVPQSETTPFYPRSPYGVAKLYAHFITVNYQESYDIFASSGILFNHESPLRGLEFVTRKITNTAAKIALKKAKTLELGNLDAKRDWGYAKEYVEGMHAMLQAPTPDTFVLSTGVTTTVRDFVKLSFEALDIGIKFEGEGINEVGLNEKGDVIVKINPAFFRPAEVDLLIGDASKAKQKLGWSAKTDLKGLCDMMIKADLRRIEAGFEF